MFAALALCLAFADPAPLFARDNLVAWCIVPFDAKKRSPEDRVDMLKRLGFKKYAYDWRAEHLPTFDRELVALKKNNIELTAIWFPALNAEGKQLIAAVEKHGLKTQLWLMLGDPAPGKDQETKVKAAVVQLTPTVEAAGKLGCRVSLYNHGNWGGEPENMVAVVKSLAKSNVGIVYNLHHGHDHLDRFPDALKLMLPHLDCLNLNGMVKGGDKANKKILPLGTGDLELQLLKTIRTSGYKGPIGILGHTNDDAEERLLDNLDGLNWLLPQLDGKPSESRPVPRTPFGGLTIRRTQPTPNGPIVFDVAGFTENERMSLKADPQDYTPDRLAKSFPVYVLDGQTSDADLTKRPALLGTYTLNGDAIRFTTRFPPTAGVTYRALFDRTTLFAGPDVTIPLGRADFTIPKVERKPTTVVAQIFPTPGKLPENTLRMYIQFSGPMSRSDAYKHVKLLGENGKEVKFAFLELEQELWSADSSRFTLLFDPGRVKHNLVPREELGPALEAGKKYTLVVDTSWEDENGTPLKDSYRKSFTAGPADEASIDVEKWKLAVVNGQLLIAFDKPLDHALAARMITVQDAKGKPVVGKVAVAEGAGSWSFTPTVAFPAGEYKIVVDTRLEDPCGNRVGTSFEVTGTSKDQPSTVERRFTVK